MTLKFIKSAPYIPDPARSKPKITPGQRAGAAADPPEVVPQQCKPWVDGGAIGWTLFFGYVSPVVITADPKGKIAVEGLEHLAAETRQPRVIDQFAAGHFGIATGYTLHTPPGYTSLILPSPLAPAGLDAVVGVVETDWYPRQLFLVFSLPPPRVRVALDRTAALARVVLVPRHEELEARQMDEAEQAELSRRLEAYLAEEKTTPTRWTAASGDTFTSVYKIWSQRYRKKG